MSTQSQPVSVMSDKRWNFEHYLDAVQHYFVTECGKSCRGCCKLKTENCVKTPIYTAHCQLNKNNYQLMLELDLAVLQLEVSNRCPVPDRLVHALVLPVPDRHSLS